MPELPEVETVRRVLKSNLVHKTIESIDVFYQGILEDSLEDFLKNTLNKTIIDIKRYGKYLIFELNEGYILSHLRMEGKYYYLENAFVTLNTTGESTRLITSSIIKFTPIRPTIA